MHQVTPDEFRVFQGNLAFWFSRLFPSGRKSDRILRKAEDPAVGDSDFVGIASQIFDGIAKAVKGFFDVRAPVFFVKTVFEFFPVIRITQFFTGGRKSKGAAFVKGGKQRHIFPLELIPQDCHRNKKFTGGFTDLSIPCQPAAGNNAVHVYMVAEFLVPGMEDLDNAGCRPEIFLIRRQFQKRSGTASVKKPVEELLITVNQGIEFMGKVNTTWKYGASMTSALRLSTQISFCTAWQFGQLRLRQELLWISMCPQSVHWLKLKPSLPDLQFIMAWAAFRCTSVR